MPYGFYVTATGVEKIRDAVAHETKCNICKYGVGDAGDNLTGWDYEKKQLNHETYKTEFNPVTDYYVCSVEDPNSLKISVIVPNEVGGLINEVGFYDNEDNLIIYGLPEGTYKTVGKPGSGTRLQFESWITFTQEQRDHVEINILDGAFTEFSNKLGEMDDKLFHFEQIFEGLDLSVVRQFMMQCERNTDDIAELKERVGTNETNIAKNAQDINDLRNKLNDDINNVLLRLAALEAVDLNDILRRLDALEGIAAILATLI